MSKSDENDAANGDLQLASEVSGISAAVPILEAASRDIDSQSRSQASQMLARMNTLREVSI